MVNIFILLQQVLQGGMGSLYLYGIYMALCGWVIKKFSILRFSIYQERWISQAHTMVLLVVSISKFLKCYFQAVQLWVVVPNKQIKISFLIFQTFHLPPKKAQIVRRVKLVYLCFQPFCEPRHIYVERNPIAHHQPEIL